MKIASLLVITVNQLLGHPKVMPVEWENFSRRAWMEPLVIRDGMHDYVLMSSEEFKKLTGDTAGGDIFKVLTEHAKRKKAKKTAIIEDKPGVPYYWACPTQPDKFIRRLNGVEERGALKNGIFVLDPKPRTYTCSECNGGGDHRSSMGEIEGPCTVCGGSGRVERT